MKKYNMQTKNRPPHCLVGLFLPPQILNRKEFHAG